MAKQKKDQGQAAAGYAAREEAARLPKFKVGDEVTCRGRRGVVSEVGEHDAHWFGGGCPQHYSVRCRAGEREVYADKNGNEQVRYRAADGTLHAHEFDVLGGVAEDEIQSAFGGPSG